MASVQVGEIRKTPDQGQSWGTQKKGRQRPSWRMVPSTKFSETSFSATRVVSTLLSILLLRLNCSQAERVSSSAPLSYPLLVNMDIIHAVAAYPLSYDRPHFSIFLLPSPRQFSLCTPGVPAFFITIPMIFSLLKSFMLLGSPQIPNLSLSLPLYLEGLKSSIYTLFSTLDQNH